LEIIDNKALLFVTKKADQITAIIPKSQIIERNGDKAKVLVHWGPDEVRILHNLKIKNVPHPILGRYDWPGVYTPFDHQRTSAAFMAMHPRCLNLSQAGCVDADTEYLTPTGWRRISEYVGGPVAQFLPDTGAIEFVEPTEYIKKPCDLMVRFKTKYGIDQLLSPEHRVLAYNNAMPDRAPVVLAAHEVLDKHDRCYAGIRDRLGRTVGPPTVAFRHIAIKPTFTTVGGAGVPLTDAQLRVQIAVIADGHYPSASTHCVVRLKRPRKVTRLRTLLAEAGIPYKEREQNTVTATGYFVFTFAAPMRTKEFGAEFWAATPAQLEVVRSEVMHWDGSFRKKGAQFCSTSTASADFVQYAFAAGGYVARITEDPRPYKSGVLKTVTVRFNSVTGLLALHSSAGPGTVSTAPSPDGFKYCFSVPSTFLLLRRNGCIFTTGNTGKTSAAAWAADYLLTRGFVRRVLIVCPVSIMDTAWRADLFRTVMNRSVAIASGSRAKRAEIIAGNYDFVIINFDGVKVVRDELEAGGFDLVIVDEATAIKNPQTDRWKALSSLLKPSTRLWLMTGTPASQSPLDAYGLAKLVNPDAVPRSATAWRNKVMTQLTQFKWVPKFNAQETVHAALQPAIRFTKEECLDLPDMLYTTRDVPLTKQQEKYYKLIKDDMAAQAAGAEITAVNAAGVINKLLQISQGVAYTTEREVVEFDISNRIDELMDVIEGTEHKVIVFVPFRHSLERLQTELSAKLGHPAVGAIHGGTPAGVRAELIKAFQTTETMRVILLIPQAAAHGITLTKADTVVWWGPTPSAELYLQGNARAHRAGQKNNVTVVRLQGSPVERRMYAMLDGKVDMHQGLVDLYKQEIA